MTQELSNLSEKLRALHQELLQSQSQSPESARGKMTAAEGPIWMMTLSDLIQRIDEKLNSDEEIEILDVQLIHAQTSGLFNGENPGFTDRYQMDSDTNPQLGFHQADVLNALQKLQPWVKNMHEMHSENEKNRYQNPQ